MKHILRTLAFFSSNPGWQSFNNDKATTAAVKSLEKRGYLKVIWYNEKDSTNQAIFTKKIM